MRINELFNLKDSTTPIDKTEVETNVLKHVLQRIGVLLATIVLVFGVATMIDDNYIILGAIIVSAGLTIIFLLFLLIECLVLYSKNKKKLANINLIIIGIFVLITGLAFLSGM